MKLLQPLRLKTASKCGMTEHRAGELLGVLLAINLWYYQGIWSVILFACWITYFIAHRLEKTIYGKHGFR